MDFACFASVPQVRNKLGTPHCGILSSQLINKFIFPNTAHKVARADYNGDLKVIDFGVLPIFLKSMLRLVY